MTQHHLSDADLLALLDGETNATQQHLASCEACRARRADLQQTSNALRQLLHAEAPASAHARTRLRAELAAQRPTERLFWAYLSTAAILLAALGVTLYRHHNVATVYAAQITPNTRLTPGATRPVALTDICNADDDDQDPAVPASTQQAVFREYGLDNIPASNYQVDYLINPQLGGTDDIRNLWPEPYRADWNARAKDALESRLHQMVCNRQIGLAEAQQQIATDWIAAYKRYFHTTHPLT